DPGIVEEAVDCTISIERGLHIVLHFIRSADVGWDEAGIAATLTHEIGARLSLDCIKVDQYDLSPTPCEAECGGAADAAPGAGDQRNFAGEFHRTPPFPCSISTVHGAG